MEAGVNLKRFLLTALIALVVLSVAWPWVSRAYAWVLFSLTSPLLGEDITVQRAGQLFQVTARHPLGGDPYVATLHSVAITYGLAVALALASAVQGVTRRGRLYLLAGILALAFVAHLVGLYLLLRRIEDVGRVLAYPADVRRLASLLTFLWLVLPSMVWLPVFLWRLVPQPAKR